MGRPARASAPTRSRTCDRARIQVTFACHKPHYAAGWEAMGGFYREVRIPNLPKGLHLEGALGPDLPPPRPAPRPLPPRRGPPARRRDRTAARPAPVHHPPRAGPEQLPRRGPRVLRLLPPTAQDLARRCRQRRRKLAADEGLREYVAERFRDDWSPQHSGWTPTTSSRDHTG